MAKKFRLNLSNGISQEGDQAIDNGKYLQYADNINLVGGTIRPFNSFVDVATVETITDTDGTDRYPTHVRRYKGRNIFSVRYRDYVFKKFFSHDVLFWTEDGDADVSQVAPKMMVDNTILPIGVYTPRSQPTVIQQETSNRSILSATLIDSGGQIKTGTVRRYRLAVETLGGIQIPTPAQQVVAVSDDESSKDSFSIRLNWTPVESAISYHLYAATTGGEKLLESFPAGHHTYLDDGVKVEGGELASTYDVNQSYEYTYTFERDIKGIVQESGIAPIVKTSVINAGRTIAFSTNSDGYFDDNSDMAITVSTGTAVLSVTQLVISAVAQRSITRDTAITTSTAHGLTSGQEVVFYKSTGDERVRCKVTPHRTNAAIFYVDNITAGIVSTDVIKLAKIRLTWDTSNQSAGDESLYGYHTDSDTISDTTALLVSLTGSDGSEFYKSRKISVIQDTTTRIVDVEANTYLTNPSTTFTLNSLKWLVDNGYINSRNLYRKGPSGGLLLVAKVGLTEDSFEDDINDYKLDQACLSVSVQNGITVITEAPIDDITGLTFHNDSMFAIDGNAVVCSEQGRPHSWPGVFRWEFASQPVALASMFGSLFVLCESGIERLDGGSPANLQSSGTGAVDGCLAPRSVQKLTDGGLLYVSKRGVIAFDGSRSKCLTDTKLNGDILFTPSGSNLVEEQSLWKAPVTSFFYAALCGDQVDVRRAYGLGYDYVNPQENRHNLPIVSLNYDLKSFVYDSKYILYWGGDGPIRSVSNYSLHTMLCIDLKQAGNPITTISLSPKHVDVDEHGRAYALALTADISGGGIPV